VAKFLTGAQVGAIVERFGAADGSLFLFVAANRKVADVSLSHLRGHVAGMMKLIPEGRMDMCWIVEPPAFEIDPVTGRLTFPHHPFTAPFAEDVPLLDTDPTAARTRAYDLVLNGWELGGGSIRISNHDLQMRIFQILGYTAQEVEERFGFFMEALRHGPPPHGGIALGLDRVCTRLLGIEDIREVIAFPKTQKAVCMLTGAPTPVGEEQLKELGLRRDV
jgi:aspartyl-tRNA synthetase